MTPSIEDKVRRPVKYLTAAKERYPDLWKRVDLLRANRDKVQQEYSWPPWCYLPLGGAAGIIGPPAAGFGKLLYNMEVSKIATLASWRLAKDIYIFDETVFEELWETPIDGAIPIDILYKLPTWCAYVAFPAPRAMEGGAVYGFFVHLNYSGMPMLMLGQDYTSVDHIDSSSIIPYPLDLQEGRSLFECLTTMHEKAKAKHGTPPIAIERLQPKEVMRWMEPLLSLTIYLCSASAEIRARDPLRGLRQDHYTKKTKKGVRTFVPDQPKVWEVAYRIGATLRAATAAAASRGTGEGGTHAGPRPHMRKAHWHSFWTGPKAAVGKPPVPAREIVVKWIPPIAVAMGPDDEAIPTVHRVTR
jgi:hypothetical protein